MFTGRIPKYKQPLNSYSKTFLGKKKGIACKLQSSLKTHCIQSFLFYIAFYPTTFNFSNDNNNNNNNNNDDNNIYPGSTSGQLHAKSDH